jgi:hypothetical protein
MNNIFYRVPSLKLKPELSKFSFSNCLNFSFPNCLKNSLVCRKISDFDLVCRGSKSLENPAVRFYNFLYKFITYFIFLTILSGSVKAFNFLLKISPVKINGKNSCPLREGNHFGLTWPNLR